MERLVICCEGNDIHMQELQMDEKTPNNLSKTRIHNHEQANLQIAKESFEREYISEALESYNWRIIATANRLIESFKKKMKRLGIEKSKTANEQRSK